MSLSLDDVFKLLETATKLKNDGPGNEIDAATKYFEAVYLLKSYVQRLPPTADQMQTKQLLNDKIVHYTKLAQQLLAVEHQEPRGHNGQPPIVGPVNPISPSARLSGFHDQWNARPNSNAYDSTSQRFLVQDTSINQISGEANKLLSKAMDLDENGDFKGAIQAYMGAAELYLRVVKGLEARGDSTILPGLVRRLQGALDRAEKLKVSKGKTERVRQGPVPSDKKNKPPAAALTRPEIEVLKRSSLIASGVFLPWSDEDAQSLSRSIKSSRLSNQLFSDPAGILKLSPKQEKRFHKWARPSEIFDMRQRMRLQQKQPVMIRKISPYTIRQQYVTDCSFIASLCICANGVNRHRLITSIIYPQDTNGQPIYNPSGKYMVKFWLNGVARQVVIDDRLPIDKHGNLMCSETTGNQHQLELWVPIVEKAYMKLCGGYDFPGSNSGIDLFSLTGWIPEQIFFPSDLGQLKDFETDPERAWSRLYNANSFGDCLITVSTTREMTESKADSLGLVTGHAYAVLNVVQSKDGVRILQMKNPWASKSWQGKYSPRDKASWNRNGLRHEVGYDPDIAEKYDDGVFWIEWNDVLAYFQNVQLSWNPALFAFTISTHQLWEKGRGSPEDTFDVGDNPQFILSLSEAAIKKRATVWILLSRHVTKQEQQGCEVEEFLTMHLVRNSSKRERIWLAQDKRTVVHGAYTNNSHVLACYDIAGVEDAFISIVLSQYQKMNAMGYTLSVFCTEAFTLLEPRQELQFIHDVPSSWTPQSAGGPTGQNGFFRNPMYLIVVKSKTILQTHCTTSKVFPVHLMIVGLPNNDTRNLRDVVSRSRNLITDSGSYRHAFTLTDRIVLEPGNYAVIVSNYHMGETGEFQLKICSSKQIQVASIE